MKQFVWDYKDEVKPLKPYWNMCVGSCHGTTALRQDYREQLEKCQRELGFRYVRFHGLFDDDMSEMCIRDRFTREGEEELEDCLIPPMMLYTFVENSVKYGLVDEAEGVHITLQIEKSREGEKQGYYFRIRDSGPGYAEDVLPVLNSGDTLLDRRGEEHYGVRCV